MANKLPKHQLDLSTDNLKKYRKKDLSIIIMELLLIFNDI